MWELKKELETRKENLILTLQNNRDFLELEKQHQIYGAIKELDHVIKIMEHHREEEVMNKPRQKIVLNNNHSAEEHILKEKDKKVRKFKSPIRLKFAKNDA